VTSDNSKGESSRKQKDFEIHHFERRINGTIGICSGNPQILFWIYHIFYFFVLTFISIEHGILLYFLFVFTIIQRTIDFCNELYVHIVV
jgi:hypothetical protein